MSTEQNIKRAREALSYFHNKSVSYSNYHITLDELLVKINRDKIGNVQNFLNFYGKAILDSGLLTADIKIIMENLADQGQGRIPSDSNVFFEALIYQVRNINWTEVVKDTALDVAEGVQSFGENVSFTLKGLNAIFPFIVIGGLMYIAITRIKKAA